MARSSVRANAGSSTPAQPGLQIPRRQGHAHTGPAARPNHTGRRGCGLLLWWQRHACVGYVFTVTAACPHPCHILPQRVLLTCSSCSVGRTSSCRFVVSTSFMAKVFLEVHRTASSSSSPWITTLFSTAENLCMALIDLLSTHSTTVLHSRPGADS